MTNSIPCVVTIAGTDPSGGAGIQADIKSISATGSYAASVVTVLVSQNTQGVRGIYPISPAFVKEQLEAVFNDLQICAVKLGMLYDRTIIEVVLDIINEYKPKNIVLDPVIMAKDKSLLLPLSELNFMKSNLFSKACLITPNLSEAEHILSQRIISSNDMENAAKNIALQYQTNVLIKGGHLDSDSSSDVLYLLNERKLHWFYEKRIHTKNTHGTGCTLSSAIASFLAQNLTLIEAIQHAKKYLTNAIRSGSKIKIGEGNGPVDHFYFYRPFDKLSS